MSLAPMLLRQCLWRPMMGRGLGFVINKQLKKYEKLRKLTLEAESRGTCDDQHDPPHSQVRELHARSSPPISFPRRRVAHASPAGDGGAVPSGSARRQAGVEGRTV